MKDGLDFPCQPEAIPSITRVREGDEPVPHITFCSPELHIRSKKS